MYNYVSNLVKIYNDLKAIWEMESNDYKL
jgi:hypothetical protein